MEKGYRQCWTSTDLNPFPTATAIKSQGAEVAIDDTTGELQFLRLPEVVSLQKLCIMYTKNRYFQLHLRYQLTSLRHVRMMSGTPKVVDKWRLIAAIECSQPANSRPVKRFRLALGLWISRADRRRPTTKNVYVQGGWMGSEGAGKCCGFARIIKTSEGT